MTQRDESNLFHISAQGPQSWEWADVELIDGRAVVVVDDDEDRALNLTRIQTAELLVWLAGKVIRGK